MKCWTRFHSNAATALLLAAAVACSDDPANPTPVNPAPAGLTAASTGETSIAVSWTAPSTTATEFILQRATGNGAFAEIVRPAGSATQYPDQGLTAGTTYRYRIAAVRNGSSSAFSSEATATTESENDPGPALVEVTTDITTDTRWTADRIYRLKGFRKVQNGATLTIDAGTRIEGDYDILGSSLFVLRGARIVANGTASAPILFTSSRPEGQRQPGDWGGLIMVGNARINRSGSVAVEGTGTSGDNALVTYSGGSNDNDNSGTLRYVIVEYAGFGPAQDAELNSFTLAAIGRGTTMEYLQALNGLDDHFEWFGGSVDAKYLVSYESGDDHFDMSEGFQGRLQYLIAYQSRSLVPRPLAGNVSTDPQGIENDGCNGSGCDDGHNSTPLTIPVVSNFTVIGGGAAVTSSGGGFGMVLRRGTGGHYLNGVIARWPAAAVGYRDAGTKTRETEGMLSFNGIYVAETPVLFQAGQQSYGNPGALEHSAATTAASLFTSLPNQPTSAAAFDWSPSASSPIAVNGFTAFSGDLATRAAGGIATTTYRGAAAPGGTKWWSGWTRYSVN